MKTRKKINKLLSSPSASPKHNGMNPKVCMYVHRYVCICVCIATAQRQQYNLHVCYVCMCVCTCVCMYIVDVTVVQWVRHGLIIARFQVPNMPKWIWCSHPLSPPPCGVRSPSNTIPPVHPAANGDLEFSGVQITWPSFIYQPWFKWDFGCPHHCLGEMVSPPASY